MEFVQSNTHIIVALNKPTGEVIYPHTTIRTDITKYTMLVMLLIVVMVYSISVL